MDVVIKSLNKIEAHPLNFRLFKQLYSDNDEQFERLLLHTEVGAVVWWFALRPGYGVKSLGKTFTAIFLGRPGDLVTGCG